MAPQFRSHDPGSISNYFQKDKSIFADIEVGDNPSVIAAVEDRVDIVVLNQAEIMHVLLS